MCSQGRAGLGELKVDGWFGITTYRIHLKSRSDRLLVGKVCLLIFKDFDSPRATKVKFSNKQEKAKTRLTIK